MKIIIIVGARPQFIKLAPLQIALKNFPIQEILIHTGQHYEHNMSAIFFDTLKLKTPDYTLNHGAKTPLAMIGDLLKDLEKIFKKEKPDFTLVFGDTNSTLAGAIASIKANIPLIHVESGLRNSDISMPEEQNRILTDRISKILFCPTQKAVHNLLSEGFDKFDCIFKNVGDIMLDSSLLFTPYAISPMIKLKKNFLLCTIHRQENLNFNALEKIFNALKIIAKKMQVILPLHPHTKQFITPFSYPNITFCPPLSYLEILYLLQHTKLVITDSGGLQKESYFFKKPSIVLRENSEWIELIEHHCNFLAGNDTNKILESFDKIINGYSFSYHHHFYGDGNSANKIVETLKEFL